MRISRKSLSKSLCFIVYCSISEHFQQVVEVPERATDDGSRKLFYYRTADITGLPIMQTHRIFTASYFNRHYIT